MKRTLVMLGATAVALIGLAAPAVADVSTNKSKNDALGYCTANHIANFNGDHHGVGWQRSALTGAEMSAVASNPPPECVTSQGAYPQISNNG